MFPLNPVIRNLTPLPLPVKHLFIVPRVPAGLADNCRISARVIVPLRGPDPAVAWPLVVRGPDRAG